MNTVTLIVDNGASKAEWILTGDGKILSRTRTPGIFHLQFSDEEVLTTFQKAITGLAENDHPPVEAIYFYSTGARTAQSRHRLSALLAEAFPEAGSIAVETDMLAAARALCLREAGIACILGTGSNACLYDGDRITDQAGGLGYILGDEGSGAGLGKRLMGAYLDQRLPYRLEVELENAFELSPEKVIDRVYRQPLPNRYLASFAPFLHQHRQDPFIAELLRTEFTRFFARYILPFQRSRTLPVNVVGSIALHFREPVIDAAQVIGLQVRTIAGDPVAGLARYHAQ